MSRKPTNLDMVKEWHLKFCQPVFFSPKISNRAQLRLSLIREELRELIEAVEVEKDIVNVAKELCDLLYVVYGTALEFGLTEALPDCFAEVHRSNLSKLDANGKPVYRQDGKVLKSELYSPADLSFIKKLIRL